MKWNKHFWVILGFTFAIQLTLIFQQYCGNFYWILWPSSYFNPPKAVTEPLGGTFMSMDGNGWGVGWDGQFYYLMSRDPFMQTESFKVGIDNPSYRYQRIGLAVTTKAVSMILGQENPSPFIYWLVNNLTFVLGLIFLSRLFILHSIPSYYLWFWGAGVGTQCVLMQGLPDAFADSLFIISLYLMSRNRWFWSGWVAILGVLTRESFAVVYGTLFAVWLSYRLFAARVPVRDFGFDGKVDLAKFKQQGWIYLLPCLAVV